MTATDDRLDPASPLGVRVAEAWSDLLLDVDERLAREAAAAQPAQSQPA